MTWVNFQTVRQELDFSEVLAHFGLQTKANGQDQVKSKSGFNKKRLRIDRRMPQKNWCPLKVG